jgi:hypothetical protein
VVSKTVMRTCSVAMGLPQKRDDRIELCSLNSGFYGTGLRV